MQIQIVQTLGNCGAVWRATPFVRGVWLARLLSYIMHDIVGSMYHHTWKCGYCSERSEVSTGALPRLYGFGLYLSRVSKRSFFLVKVSWAPPLIPSLSLTLADSDIYLQENTECLQARRFRGFTSSCLKDRVGLNLRPCSRSPPAASFSPWEMSNSDYSSLGNRH